MPGILPIALAFGAGWESRVPMGVAVVGGMVLATGLRLFAVPAVYTYFTRTILTAVEAEAAKAEAMAVAAA